MKAFDRSGWFVAAKLMTRSVTILSHREAQLNTPVVTGIRNAERVVDHEAANKWRGGDVPEAVRGA